MNADLKRLIDQVSREKGIDRQTLIHTLEEAIKSAIKKKYGGKLDLDVTFNEEFGELEAFLFKEVAVEVTDPEKQISLEEALQMDPEAQVGDELGVRMDTDTLGRIAAQSAKQVIIQKMKDAEREVVYEEFKGRKGDIVNGIVQRADKSGVIVNLGQAEAVLPSKEQIPREIFRQGDRIRAFVLEVKKISKGPQVILSRTHPHFLIKLFLFEVPEIGDGVVSIINAAREPGSRAKIAVISKNPDVDPVGACVGMKGSRVQNVVQELRGERIDIIPWNMDPAKFVVNALAPAIISKVIIDQSNRNMEVIVADDQLSLAIGRHGQNVRLASELVGWSLNIFTAEQWQKHQEEASAATEPAPASLAENLPDDEPATLEDVPGIGEKMIEALKEAGFDSVEKIANATVEDLTPVKGLGTIKAEKIVANCRKLLGK